MGGNKKTATIVTRTIINTTQTRQSQIRAVRFSIAGNRQLTIIRDAYASSSPMPIRALFADRVYRCRDRAVFQCSKSYRLAAAKAPGDRSSPVFSSIPPIEVRPEYAARPDARSFSHRARQ